MSGNIIYYKRNNEPKAAKRPGMELVTKPKTKPAMRPAIKLESIEKFPTGLATGSADAKEFSPSWINIYYNH